MNIKDLLNKSNKKKLYDLVMSVSAVVVFNMVIQLFIYPFIEKRLGMAGFGAVRSMMAFTGITAGSLGVAANYSRMMTEKEYHPSNSNFFYILLCGGLGCAMLGVGYMHGLGVLTPVSALLFGALIILTTYRYYSDVDFRLKTDFFGYMIYYLAIAAGYAVGTLVYLVTKQWFFAFIVGEVSGIAFVIIRGSIYKKALARPDGAAKRVISSMGYLFPSTFMENLTLNADGLVLVAFCGEEAVTIFYTASLLGKVIAMLSGPLNSIIISYIVKSNVKLSARFWTVAVFAVSALGILAFVGCRIVSPWFIGNFYEDALLSATAPYLSAAILGQIFYFVSGILLIVLLKFNGEKRQFLINSIYCAEFYLTVTAMTALMGLQGFVLGTLIANAVRFFGVLTLGYFSVAAVKKKQLQN